MDRDQITKCNRTKEQKTISQLKTICSKPTTETLKKVWNVFKVNNKNTRMTSLTSCRRCFIINFEQIPNLFLVFLYLILDKQMLTGKMDYKLWYRLHVTELHVAYMLVQATCDGTRGAQKSSQNKSSICLTINLNCNTCTSL